MSTCAEKDKEARNGYAKAIQDLNTAQANYDRTKALYDGGSVPKVDLETAENGLNDAKRERDSYTVKNGTAVADDSYRLQIEKAKYDYEKATESLEDNRAESADRRHRGPRKYESRTLCRQDGERCPALRDRKPRPAGT